MVTEMSFLSSPPASLAVKGLPEMTNGPPTVTSLPDPVSPVLLVEPEADECLPRLDGVTADEVRALTGDLTSALDPLPEDFRSALDPLPVDFRSALDPLPEDLTSPLDPLPNDLTSAIDPFPEDFTSAMEPLPGELTFPSDSLSGDFTFGGDPLTGLPSLFDPVADKGLPSPAAVNGAEPDSSAVTSPCESLVENDLPEMTKGADAAGASSDLTSFPDPFEGIGLDVEVAEWSLFGDCSDEIFTGEANDGLLDGETALREGGRRFLLGAFFALRMSVTLSITMRATPATMRRMQPTTLTT